jgi:hypothetical protein
VLARDALARAPAANRFPKSTNKARRSFPVVRLARDSLSGDGACERIATSSNETRRRAVESRFSVGKKKKRHLFFDENAVGAD